MQVIQLYIEGERVDMFSDESVNITQTIQNVKDVSKVFTDFSKTFTLPASKTNNRIFEHYYNFNIVDGFDARTKKNARIELNHKPFRKGKIKLEGVDLKENKAYAYKITFFGNTVDLKDLLGEDSLSSLDWLNNFNQTYSASAVRTGLTNGYNKTVDSVAYNDAVVAPLITHTTRLYYNSDNSAHSDYPDADGGNLYAHGTHHHGVYYGELKYAIRIHLIIKAIENNYGIQFSQDFFSLTNDSYYNLYLWLHRKKGNAFDSSEVTYQIVEFPLDTISMTGVSCLGDRLLIFNNPRGVSYDLVITSATTSPYTVIIKKDGQVFDSKYITSGNALLSGVLSNSSTGYTVFIQTSTSMTNVVADWQLTSIQYAESHDYTTNQFTITLTQEFIITEQLPDMKVLDFLTGIFKMFNLTAYEEDGVIIVRTLDSFYSSSTKTWNITDYVDVNTSSVDIALPYKRIDFKYENLDTKLAKQHEQISLNGWGTVKYDAGENFDAGGDIYNVVAPFEHMKYERLIDSNTEGLVTPQVGWFVDDNNDPYYGKPLLFYPISVTGTEIRFLNAIDTSSYNDISTYFIPSNSLSLDSAVSNDNINFNQELNEYTFGNDFTGTLFNNYYNNYISEVFNESRRITKVKAFLPINFLINYTLADKIQIGDKVYIINSINSNLLNGESSLELLNVVSAAVIDGTTTTTTSTTTTSTTTTTTSTTTTTTCTPNGTLLSTFCFEQDLYGTYADGNCGTYNALIEANSPSCVTTTTTTTTTCTPAGTLLYEFCVGQDLWGMYADGSCGEYGELIEFNSPTCPTTTTTTTTTSTTTTTTTQPADNVFTVERQSDGFATYVQYNGVYSVNDLVTLSNDGSNCYEIMGTDYVIDPFIYPTISGACATTTTTTTTTTEPCVGVNLYTSLVSGDDAACNQTVTRTVYLDAGTLAGATQVYGTSTDCSSLASGTRYYSEVGSSFYYTWNGTTLTGPTLAQCP